MHQPNEEYKSAFLAAQKHYMKLNEEYSSKYVSTSPLGNGPVPTFLFQEIKEMTERLQEAEKIYLEIRSKYLGF